MFTCLGQTRPVQTIRFIAKGTIEENMVALQQRKMQLAKMTFNENDEDFDEDNDGLSKKEALQKQKLADLRNLFK